MEQKIVDCRKTTILLLSRKRDNLPRFFLLKIVRLRKTFLKRSLEYQRVELYKENSYPVRYIKGRRRTVLFLSCLRLLY